MKSKDVTYDENLVKRGKYITALTLELVMLYDYLENEKNSNKTTALISHIEISIEDISKYLDDTGE